MPSDRAAVPPPAAASEELAVRRLAAELGPFAAGRIDAGRLAEAFARLEAAGRTPGAPGADGAGGADAAAPAGRAPARRAAIEDPAGWLAAWLLRESGVDPAGGPEAAG